MKINNKTKTHFIIPLACHKAAKKKKNDEICTDKRGIMSFCQGDNVNNMHRRQNVQKKKKQTNKNSYKNQN